MSGEAGGEAWGMEGKRGGECGGVAEVLDGDEFARCIRICCFSSKLKRPLFGEGVITAFPSPSSGIAVFLNDVCFEPFGVL